MTGKLTYYIRLNTRADGQQLEQIVACFKARKVKRNTIILSENEVCNEFYFVAKGILRTYYLTKQGQEKTRYVIFDGAAGTAISSFISRQPSFEFMDALEDSEIYAITHDDFFRLTKEIPAWAEFYRTMLEMAYVFQNKKIETLVTLSAKQRYQKLLEEHPIYVQKLSNKTLASYLDITPETLSRLKPG